MKFFNPVVTHTSYPRRDFFNHLEQMFDNVSRADSFQPHCDIVENKERFLVSIDVPGINKEDIKIAVEENHLIISGERQQTINVENGEGLNHQERRFGRFERTFVLPTTVDQEKIEADYENGVLQLSMPKAKLPVGRTIQVRSKES